KASIPEASYTAVWTPSGVRVLLMVSPSMIVISSSSSRLNWSLGPACLEVQPRTTHRMVGSRGLISPLPGPAQCPPNAPARKSTPAARAATTDGRSESNHVADEMRIVGPVACSIALHGLLLAVIWRVSPRARHGEPQPRDVAGPLEVEVEV